MEAVARLGWLTWKRFLPFSVATVVVRAVIPSDRIGQGLTQRQHNGRKTKVV